ncbi:hypothetical protein KDW_61150 [Dictyobacter vulcani]|uniref:3-keto-alpha-glucoside-1,2-lyase/3-keto-2-hydroxy-glucal hydratase domain-containing protein n=1 Tax=Dictyobacter vulcani TaxID=2607529 RepID=A0A5J4KWU5_9CHLR|nr:family 16 glycoside hydrolase [Dictyobacter vulcani]GER91953.1 hypothetical protein KDW_61150 [Dictyobacter vulcani]
MVSGNIVRRWWLNIDIRCAVVLFCVLGGLLTGCSGGASGQTNNQPKPTPRPTQSQAGKVLYQSSWAGGLKDWKATAGWKLSGDYAQTDLGEHRILTVPYQSTAANYSLEFSLQVVSVPKDGGYFMLNADPNATHDGYQNHVLNLLDAGKHGYATHPLLETVIDPDIHQEPNVNPQAFDYEPGNQWHTYRVDVEAERVQFFVDNVRLSQSSSAKTANLSTGPFHLDCGKAILRVKDFKVTAL